MNRHARVVLSGIQDRHFPLNAVVWIPAYCRGNDKMDRMAPAGSAHARIIPSLRVA